MIKLLTLVLLSTSATWWSLSAQTPPAYRYAEIVTRPFFGLPLNSAAAVDSGQVDVRVTRSGRVREFPDLDYAYPSVATAMSELSAAGWEYVEAVTLNVDACAQLRWVVRRPLAPAENATSATPTAAPEQTAQSKSNR